MRVSLSDSSTSSADHNAVDSSHATAAVREDVGPKTVLQPAAKRGKFVTDEVWIIAGDDALMPDFVNEFRSASARSDLHWQVRCVRLPTDLVLHTGVAIAQVLFAIDAGLLKFGSACRLHCAVSECALRRWPTTSQRVHELRLDNINSSLRAFGVDGQNTRRAAGSCQREFLLRSSLGSFVMLGDQVQGDIEADVYKRRLTKIGKRALTDENLAEELTVARSYTPRRAPNGFG